MKNKNMSDDLFRVCANHASAVGAASGFLSGIATHNEYRHVREAAMDFEKHLSKSFDELRKVIERQQAPSSP